MTIDDDYIIKDENGSPIKLELTPSELITEEQSLLNASFELHLEQMKLQNENFKLMLQKKDPEIERLLKKLREDIDKL